ncbi:NADH:ubiquinone reductase (Na(+)-transporting) subunit F [Candidatus Riflebacteria bacterium]
MSTLQVVLISTGVFTTVIVILVCIILVIEKALVQTGPVSIAINDDASLTKTVPAGQTLLSALAGVKLLLPSACGGGGTCAMCKCVVKKGGGDILPTELGHLTRKEQKSNVRLACQLKVKNDLALEIPDEIFNIKKFQCTVRSNDNVATFIKEFLVDIDEGQEPLNFKAGGYIQIDIPEYSNLKFKDFEIQKEYHPDWDRFKVWDYIANNPEPIYRAYSMANHPAEGNIVMLNIRIATPPPNVPDAPPGLASSYIFNLKKGDKVTISGPYGEFFAKDTDREMCFIGGGAGMAPLRSHVFNQFHILKTQRKVTYWYGARSLREMFYEEHFRKIEKDFPNFKFYIALSDALPEDNWTGMTGFIHQVVFDEYLKDHPEPENIEYYLCGPPPMINAVQKMLYELGVEKDMILLDEF